MATAEDATAAAVGPSWEHEAMSVAQKVAHQGVVDPEVRLKVRD